MKLPNADRADVSREKIVDYLLNPLHPDGTGKAAFFVGHGFTVEQWSHFADVLRQLAVDNPVVSHVDSAHGTKYVIDGELQSPAGKNTRVRTVWIVDAGAKDPRLVTAYPQSRESEYAQGT